MGAWFRWIKKIFENMIPKNWDIKLSFVPNLAAAKTLTGGAANVYGNLVELLSNAANTTDCWVEGLVLQNPDTKNINYFVAISREAAGAPPVVIEAEIPHKSEATVATDDHEVYALRERIYFPAGTGIRAACAEATGGKAIDVYALISRGR